MPIARAAQVGAQVAAVSSSPTTPRSSTRAAERGDVVRDVGGAAEPVLLVLEADHRDRRFGRDAFDAADR